jgi:uncharacterized protein (DUF2384 family)
MAVQISTARTTAAELQYAMEHPSEAFIRHYAIEVFGDRNRAEDWLSSEIPALGNSSPESLLKSNVDESLRGVLSALVQIDYGVVS